MGVDVVQPLRLRFKRHAGRAGPPGQPADPARKVSVNALIGVGLWILLWLGYNTGPELAMDPNFPVNFTEFIHGVRAFFPMLAGWIALLIIFARASRLFPWIVGPLGLMLLYAVTGMVATWAYLPNPLVGLYYGANYLAIVLVLLAIVLVADPLPDLFKVLRVTWLMSTVLTLALLGAIPLLGSQVTFETDTSPVGMRAYSGVGTIMGMTSSRNTGFARYAAISALVALPGLMRKGKLVVRIIWGTLFTVSMYALVIANGRTETLAFIGGAVVILGAEKAKRTAYFLVGIGAAVLLGLRGFYSAFFLWFTRTGQLDLTMSGRTVAWEEGWTYLAGSPWVGLGFQSDRYFLHTHMHNAFLHVLFQAGFLGGGGILIGYAIVSYYVIKYFFLTKPADKSLISPEIPAIFLFVTISSITESTFAYFSATWLMGAPIVAYVMALHQHMRAISAKATQERTLRLQLARRAFRAGRSSGGTAAPPLGSSGGVNAL
jgi:O-antigen ligase